MSVEKELVGISMEYLPAGSIITEEELSDIEAELHVDGDGEIDDAIITVLVQPGVSSLGATIREKDRAFQTIKDIAYIRDVNFVGQGYGNWCSGCAADNEQIGWRETFNDDFQAWLEHGRSLILANRIAMEKSNYYGERVIPSNTVHFLALYDYCVEYTHSYESGDECDIYVMLDGFVDYPKLAEALPSFLVPETKVSK